MKTDFILAFIFVFLGLVALFPVFLVVVGEVGLVAPGTKNLSSLIKKHDAVILSVGTIFLVAGLGLITTRLGNLGQETATRLAILSQEKMAADNALALKASAQTKLKIAKEIKLSEFRQTWINEMREDLAEYTSLMGHVSQERDVQRETMLSTRIFLRLNHREALARDLRMAIIHVEAVRSDWTSMNERDAKSALATEVANFASCGQKILKTEWKRLKDDLDKAMQIQREFP